MSRLCLDERCVNESGPWTKVIKFGSFRRKSDGARIQKFFCKNCNTHFSSATEKPERYQKLRHFNGLIETFLASNVSMRRIAMMLGISRTTVYKKMVFLGKQSLVWHENWLKDALRTHGKEFLSIQFDDLITFEHSRLKQLSVPLVVSKKSRKIIAFDVCQIPTSGKNAEKARKKYGPRPDEHPQALDKIFRALKSKLSAGIKIASDQHPNYGPVIRKYFPRALYTQELSREAIIAGQGEIKEKANDPLFSINHTCAMLRANVNRLIRRTWCTTKKRENLKLHLAIYAKFQNSRLTPVPVLAVA